MTGVLRIQARSEILGREKGVVFGDWENAALLVEVVHGSHTDRPRAYTKGCVLYDLKLRRVGVREVWSPSWASIVYRTTDEGLVG